MEETFLAFAGTAAHPTPEFQIVAAVNAIGKDLQLRIEELEARVAELEKERP